MAVDLNQEVCANCGTRLTDKTSVVENEGTLYCCSNCFVSATRPGMVAAIPNPVRCSHCGVILLEPQRSIQRGFDTFCCNNCANAPEREHVGRPA